MPTLFTIGHSTRQLSEFLDLLQVHRITHVVDVRTLPRSRRLPWFNSKALASALKKSNIHYQHMPLLGGLRHARKDSINQGWINASFRGFADYMQTSAFYTGLKSLNQLLRRERRVAIMCAEAVPWRCHRSLIGDAELVRGITVLDIMSRTAVHQHALTKFAEVDRRKRPIQITYPKKMNV